MESGPLALLSAVIDGNAGIFLPPRAESGVVLAACHHHFHGCGLHAYGIRFCCLWWLLALWWRDRIAILIGMVEWQIGVVLAVCCGPIVLKAFNGLDWCQIWHFAL